MAEIEFYTEQFRVMDCDCDMNHRLTPGAFLRMAQQISTDQCESIGMNDEFYRQNHAVFLLAKLALYLPVSSPFSVPFRLLTGDIEYSDLGISMGILLISIVIVSLISAKIYSASVMHYGKMLKWKEIAGMK